MDRVIERCSMLDIHKSQITPFLTTSPAATNGNAHAHESAYAKTTKEASGERLIALAIGSSLLITPGL